MDDIVGRLYRVAGIRSDGDAKRMLEAADEIKRLRSEIRQGDVKNERLRAENELLRDTKGCSLLDMKEEIERLREALFRAG